MDPTPSEFDAVSKRDGLLPLDRIRALRAKFGLSFAEARAVKEITDGKTIVSHEQLLSVLKDSLGYCGCAYDSAIPFLRDFLRLAAERTDCAGDTDRFSQASERLIELLKSGGSSAMQSWFVYALDKADMVMHGFNLYDILIMENGRNLLNGLERYSEPAATKRESPEASA